MQYPEAIIYENENQFNALMQRVDNRLRNENAFKGCSETFFYPLINPYDGRLAAVLKRDVPEWEIVENEITPNEINHITRLDSSWYLNDNDI